MTRVTLRLDIVSAEQEIFSGEAKMVLVTGELGELGIMPGHMPLLTSLKPGNVRVVLPDTQEEEIFYVSSGMLEIQPFVVTILADTAMRAVDIDEAMALEAKQRAERELQDRHAELDFAGAAARLAEAIAQIRAIQHLKKRGK
jgi:F-type H+-transporting ATPase subunit epsilon